MAVVMIVVEVKEVEVEGLEDTDVVMIAEEEEEEEEAEEEGEEEEEEVLRRSLESGESGFIWF